MCDTFVALANATQNGSVIFGKNSDREPNEAQELVFIPRAEHEKGSQVDCTYISLPQVGKTNAVLLSKPFWIWGAEMGANEHGVVIGNEAVFTKIPYDKSPGLIGMDFLRLALERSQTADEALDIMIDLLETYGQGGDCGFAHHLYYHNGFLIADRKGAWVFETAGKHWAAEKVRDIRSISNAISIGSTWDRASDDLVNFAIRKGWCKSESDFNFGKCYSDLIYTKFSDGRSRQCRTMDLLEKKQGEINVPYAMNLLRDHGPDASESWQPGNGLTGAEVCMHASFGPIRVSQTTGSMISELSDNGDTHWVTGTSAPCTSIFKPVWFDSGLPKLGPQPTGTYDETTLWWRHENLHREILRDYSNRIQEIRVKRNAFEHEIWNRMPDVLNGSTASRAAFTKDCFDGADQREAGWMQRIVDLPINQRRPLMDKLAWRGFDKKAKRHIKG